MEKGWIKLHRQLQECWIWRRNEPFDMRSAWVDLLLSANHSDKKILFDGELITVGKGQILTSVRKLSDNWNWSTNRVYRFLKLLEQDGMLKKESNKSRTLLTIVNYGVYQFCENTNGHSNGYTNEYTGEYTNGYSDGYSDETPTDTVTEHKQECKELKNDKNVKNVENEKNNKERGSYEPRKKGDPYYPDDELLETAFREFLSMRIKIKKPLATKQALTRMMNKIQTLSGGDNDLAVKILNQSTDHCWTDVYDLKNDYNGRQKKTDYNKPIDWSGV